MAAIECQHCGASVNVRDRDGIRSGHAASSKKSREWIIYHRGYEVHRCSGSASTKPKS